MAALARRPLLYSSSANPSSARRDKSPPPAANSCASFVGNLNDKIHISLQVTRSNRKEEGRRLISRLPHLIPTTVSVLL